MFSLAGSFYWVFESKELISKYSGIKTYGFGGARVVYFASEVGGMGDI
jgi:hypothetical protein